MMIINQLKISFTEEVKGRIDVSAEGEFSVHFFRGVLSDLPSLLKKMATVKSKEDILLMRIELYNLGKKLMEDNQPNEESLVTATEILEKLLSKMKK